MFQSRNRETYDSNDPNVAGGEEATQDEFQSRNRETYDSNSTLFEPLLGLL